MYVYVLWAAASSDISPSWWWLLRLSLITSALSLDQTLNHRAVCLIFPHADTIDTHSDVISGEVVVWTVMCQSSLLLTWPNSHRDGPCVDRHFLVYGNKHGCFIAFLWALASNNYQSTVKYFGISKQERGRTACTVLTKFSMRFSCCSRFSFLLVGSPIIKVIIIVLISILTIYYNCLHRTHRRFVCEGAGRGSSPLLLLLKILPFFLIFFSYSNRETGICCWSLLRFVKCVILGNIVKSYSAWLDVFQQCREIVYVNNLPPVTEWEKSPTLRLLSVPTDCTSLFYCSIFSPPHSLTFICNDSVNTYR